jgi:uncharacterized protein YfiM (DUF2279 family)
LPVKYSAALLCLLAICFVKPCAGAPPQKQISFSGALRRTGAFKSASPDLSPRRRPDDWFTADKADHFFTSAMLSAGTYLALRVTHNDEPTAFVSSLTGTLTIGIGKEVWDVFHPGTPSWKDLTADLLGTLLGISSAYALTAE